MLTSTPRSTPVPLQAEKFYIPDAVRILDALVETLTY
jgi:2-oxoisovalerate dehydrogenase E1 component beta subunit